MNDEMTNIACIHPSRHIGIIITVVGITTDISGSLYDYSSIAIS